MVFPLFEEELEMHRCQTCKSYDVRTYNHVGEFVVSTNWPTVCVLDPHPRKPHMLLWATVDPSDDIWIVADAAVLGEPKEVKLEVERIESAYKLLVAQRIMDPNMGASVAGIDRRITWQDEFNRAGLNFALGDDSDVGRSRINEYLKPDRARMGPRMHFHTRCEDTILQMKRYTWDENKRGLEKDVKQKPRTRNDDYPTMLKYLMNSEPTFRGLRGFGQVVHATGIPRSEHMRRRRH